MSWAAILSASERLPLWAAILAAVVIVPLWLVTAGLIGGLFEVISQLDGVRVRRGAHRSPSPQSVRWAGAGAAWVLAISTLSGGAAGALPLEDVSSSAARSSGEASIGPATTGQSPGLAAPPSAMPRPAPTATTTPTAVATPSPAQTASPPPTPSPTPSLVVVVYDENLAATDDRTVVKGSIGTYAWTDVSFPEEQAVLRWSVTAQEAPCQLRWTVSGNDGSKEGGRVSVDPGANVKGGTRFDTDYAGGAAEVQSSCPVWRLSIQGDSPPPPTPRPTQRTSGGSCHPSYEGACLRPDASDYDCAGGSGNGPYYVDGPIYVVGWDEYDLDRDNDGLGCE